MERALRSSILKASSLHNTELAEGVYVTSLWHSHPCARAKCFQTSVWCIDYEPRQYCALLKNEVVFIWGYMRFLVWRPTNSKSSTLVLWRLTAVMLDADVFILDSMLPKVMIWIQWASCFEPKHCIWSRSIFSSLRPNVKNIVIHALSRPGPLCEASWLGKVIEMKINP